MKIIAAAVIVSAGFIVCTVIGSRAFVRAHTDETISVTGSAKRRIRSDWIVWHAQVSARANDMSGAYHLMAANIPKVTAYLEKKGVAKKDIVVSAILTVPIHPRSKEGGVVEEVISSYQMVQSVEVRSAEVDKIEEISRQATELIEQGIALESNAPEYHYTKLGELKIQMLAEAAKDTRARAEQIAISTGAHLGVLRSAHMGVMQINAADSTETSGEGNNDVSSLEKDVMAVVTSTFALD